MLPHFAVKLQSIHSKHGGMLFFNPEIPPEIGKDAYMLVTFYKRTADIRGCLEQLGQNAEAQGRAILGD